MRHIYEIARISEEGDMICKYCGSQNEQGNRVCTVCGREIKEKFEKKVYVFAIMHLLCALWILNLNVLVLIDKRFLTYPFVWKIVLIVIILSCILSITFMILFIKTQRKHFLMLSLASWTIYLAEQVVNGGSTLINFAFIIPIIWTILNCNFKKLEW